MTAPRLPVPGWLPLSMASRNAFSISFCEVIPTIFRNFLISMFTTSSFITSLLLFVSLAYTSVHGYASETVRLATTTSTENSGLLDILLPEFEKHNDAKVHVIAVGTGKALRLVREGDVDVVLVHARAAEDSLIAQGYGMNRRDVMYNDFVLVGPQRNPAGVLATDDITSALSRIAATASSFISRGDDSGTHKKELQLWREAKIQPAGAWYREAGQGMGKILQMAGEMQAYTLTDRGTWLALREKIPLAILSEGDTRLFNPYGIIAVHPKRYPDSNYKGAMQLIEWITSPAARKIIGNFRIDGQPLFTPMANQGMPAQ